MSYYNLDEYKSDPNKYSLRPERAGFNIPSFDMPDYQPVEPESFGGQPRFASPSSEYASDSNPLFNDIGQYDFGSSQMSEPSGYGGRNAPTPREASTGFSQRSPSRSSSPTRYSSTKGSSTSTTTFTPTGIKPRIGALPSYALPKMDRGRISELTELGMGQPLGKLRRGLNRALIESRYSGNPNVRGLQKRQALSGFGTGIGDIRTSAHRTAMGEYMPEYQASLGKSAAEYQAGVNRVSQQFQADMSAYLKMMKQRTTSTSKSKTTHN